MDDRTALADALHQAGEAEAAADLFREAEAMQKDRQPQYPLLYSLPGFRYCGLLLGGGSTRRRGGGPGRPWNGRNKEA